MLAHVWWLYPRYFSDVTRNGVWSEVSNYGVFGVIFDNLKSIFSYW
ncbi:hypothetical protein VCR31J2_1270238 [Vibrio coralliirubri]|uniref:Uncharacterized protein n=1 Tax=Vibrio coralliirubri TaxID=1516159 RepID=A0AA87BYW9_9VIBR|nr:hypothetical protein VCR31J2_1270238 [Vibrio coralliirubri]